MLPDNVDVARLEERVNALPQLGTWLRVQPHVIEVGNRTLTVGQRIPEGSVVGVLRHAGRCTDITATF